MEDDEEGGEEETCLEHVEEAQKTIDVVVEKIDDLEQKIRVVSDKLDMVLNILCEDKDGKF